MKMPNQPGNKHRMVRFSNDDWADLGALAEAMGTDRSMVLRQLAQWWMRRRGVRLPGRPDPGQVERAAKLRHDKAEQ